MEMQVLIGINEFSRTNERTNPPRKHDLYFIFIRSHHFESFLTFSTFSTENNDFCWRTNVDSKKICCTRFEPYQIHQGEATVH